MATLRLRKRGAAKPRQLELTSVNPRGPWFNERRALEVFRVLADCWEHRDDPLRGGFYAGLTAPQQIYTPSVLRADPIKLGQYLFFQSLTMRGGINSDDAFRSTRILWEHHPHLFDPHIVAAMPEAKFFRAIREVARDFQGADSEKGAGTYSYKLEEHVDNWRENAGTLIRIFDGDIQNVYRAVTSREHRPEASRFEATFRAVDGTFAGMQRKIFSLLTLWLQEFGLVERFALPLIVDFHCLRILFEHEILLAPFARLGPGNTKNRARRRPPGMRRYPAVRVSNRLVDAVIRWSEDFLVRHGLDSYPVSHGLWFLSRELCADYYGNKSFAKSDRKRRAVTARLVKDEELRSVTSWPMSYRDSCRFCPVEATCRIRIPAGPYYDWGVMVRAGEHLTYPGRAPELMPGWRQLPGRYRNAKSRRGLARRPAAKPRAQNGHQLKLFQARKRQPGQKP
ncbi:hypothetical protein HY442_02260 [Candidatus Parcubacteria bacterium]|nr:hypothetical protein [Candidatus Parcubacteria bacterium]MBI4385612.1 hypothetical protein [Candidatus Parcubacteria bacterium]